MLLFKKSWLVSAAFALMSGLSLPLANQLPHPAQAPSDLRACYASPVIAANQQNDPLFMERHHPFVAVVDASMNDTKKPDRVVHATVQTADVNTHGDTSVRVAHHRHGYGTGANSDLYWLSRIIEAEAGGEPMSAKLAVGQVVMNRVHSPEFPDTVHDVVFQRTCGVYEFSPVANGTIYNTPSAESIQAAKEVLSGSVNIVPSALVFYNPSLTSMGNWVRQRHVIESIGHLTFAE
jgi:hypothetical protein